MENSGHYLSAVIFFPAAAAILLMVVRSERLAKALALGATLVEFVLSIPLYMLFTTAGYQMQFGERVAWIPTFGIQYAVGIDGISLLMILLTTFLLPICVAVSWRGVTHKVKEFMICLLVIESAMIGVFASLDFVLFYVFWEAMLIPMVLIIGVWGGPNRIYAAVKFFLYTLVGSLLLLVAMIALYFEGGRTFDILTLMQGNYSPSFQTWVFLAFFAAFAVKVPMFPFHTWLPDAHVEAPTAGSVILASILLKMGAYGFLRFCLPMLPQASVDFTPMILTLSVVAIVYGAAMALAQTDWKKLIAYSSVSHMGFVTLGIFAMNVQGIEGAILQMVNHGIITGGLFLGMGIVYERTHTRAIADYGGIAARMPLYATIYVIFALASLGLPGTNGFVGEFLALLGAFIAYRPYAVAAALGIILAAVYLLVMVRRILFGPITRPENERLTDLNGREFAVLAPLVVLIFWIGFYPNPLLNKIHSSVAHLVSRQEAPVEEARTAPVLPAALAKGGGE